MSAMDMRRYKYFVRYSLGYLFSVDFLSKSSFIFPPVSPSRSPFSARRSHVGQVPPKAVAVNPTEVVKAKDLEEAEKDQASEKIS